MGEFDLKTSVDALEHTDFGSLLGAPLQACVDAQMQAAYATTDYLDRVCFKYNPETETYETVTVSFGYSTEDGDKRITLPLASVMPIPFLQIHNVNLHFAADVSVADGQQLMAKVSADGYSATGRTSTSQQETGKTQYSNDIKVDVNVVATSSDMPMGVAKLLQVMQQFIQQKDIEPDDGDIEQSTQDI
jgi:hypothetical protein